MRKYLLLTIVLVSGFCFSQNLKKEILQITKDKNGTVAVSVLDFGNDKTVHINGNKKLPMLSVFKFHIGLAVLNEVDQGKLNLDQKILIKKSDLLENTWSPIRERFPEGDIEMPLGLLIKYTVAESDNNGCDILLRLIGGTETVQKFINSKGIRNFTIKVNEEQMHQGFEFMYLNTTTANSANQLLKDFRDKKIVSKTSTDFLMTTMLETSTGKNKIVAQLPESVPVAHKTGSSGRDGTTYIPAVAAGHAINIGTIGLTTGGYYQRLGKGAPLRSHSADGT